MSTAQRQGGIAAACCSAESGARVCLLEPGEHVGGHLASGICTTEVEHMLPESFRGWMGRFLREIGKRYGVDGPLHRWELHVAEAVFEAMLAEAGVVVARSRELEQVDGRDNRIRSARLSDGSAVAATVWIDASYEGDLMAMAGVSYTVGRESRDAYGESLAGMRFIDDLSQVHNNKGHAMKIDETWRCPCAQRTVGGFPAWNRR